jgi:hypothetical protein
MAPVPEISGLSYLRCPCISSCGGHNDRVSNHSPEPGDVDWLDLGPDPDAGKPPRDPRRRYLWYGGAAALVVALLVARSQNGTDRAASAPRSPAATVSPSSPATSVSALAPASSGSFANPTPRPTPLPSGSVQVRNPGHRLLDVPPDWELFAMGEDSIVRIQLALGRATITAIPKSNPDAPAVFFVGADRVLVRPSNDTPPFVVRDDKPPTDLPQSLRQSSLWLPGPDSRHMWADQGGGGLALVTLDGKPTGATIDVPFFGSVMGSDGTGYVLLSGIGGIYYAKPGAVHRITSGGLVASGPTRWLTIECGDDFSCALVVTDRATGAHRTLDTPLDTFNSGPGVMSPDGRTVAMPRSDGISSAGIELFDLDSGLRRAVDVFPSSTNPAGPSFVWSPDSRWLFTVDAGGRVMVINRATGRAAPLDMNLPQVLQLAWRPHTG